MINKLIRIIAALLTAALLTLTAFADSAGFAVEKERALAVRAPFEKNRVTIRWNTDDGENVGAPISCGNYVLLPTLNTVRRLSEKDGSLAGVAMLEDKVAANLRGAVLGGVLVQPTRSGLYAINTEDMTVLCSREFGEITTDVALMDGLAYFGAKRGGGYSFFCADYTKEFSTVWEFKSEDPLTSPALYGRMVVFGAGEDLIVHSADTDEYKTNHIGEQLSDVLAGSYAIFMTTASDNVCKIRLEPNGTAEADTLAFCKVGGGLTAPAEYNNRLYVGSSDGFFVIDALNMEVMKSFPDLKNSSAPVICYGAGQRAYTVAHDDRLDRDVLYSILDTDDEQTVSEIVKMIDYTDGECDVSAAGTMYFRTADGKLWAISETENDLFTIIIKVVLTLAIFAMLIVIIIAWSKKRRAKRPPEY